MDAFSESLLVRAATIDELLSRDFEPLQGQKADADLAAQRLAAWCRSCASGDWSLFSRRLARDQLSIDHVLARFARVRRDASAPVPQWVKDASWVEAALHSPSSGALMTALTEAEPCAFEHLLTPLVEQATALLFSSTNARAFDNLAESARTDLYRWLLKELSDLFAPALYDLFAQARKASTPSAAEPQWDEAKTRYNEFVSGMRAGGFHRLFTDKPVLLRLAATIVRQWIDVSGEFIARLEADLIAMRRDILLSDVRGRVARIECDLSDPHNDGHSVLIVRFQDDTRVVYKPKDLRLDVSWHALVERLNREGAPVELKAARAIAREGYGWSEFIDHAGCRNLEDCVRFFRRAGSWLALFHCLAANDMHHENMIAAGDHPVPIDLETILQAEANEHKSNKDEAQAFEVATDIIANSVSAVGLLPAYGKSPENAVFAVGGMVSDLTQRSRLAWRSINSDAMQPFKSGKVESIIPNLPHINGRYAKFGDHIDDFVAGFEEYAKFLLRLTRDSNQGALFEGLTGALVRKVLRPTQFYYMLLRRLKNHRRTSDGITWSAQVDFLARLADWENDTDSFWALQHAERAALTVLNVPYFVSSCDGQEIRDKTGISVRTQTVSGLTRARARVLRLNEQEISWQVEVIRQNASSVRRSAGSAIERRRLLCSESVAEPTKKTLLAEADKIASELSTRAIRRPPAAAWVGLDWLGDSEVGQLAPLGPDLYNGVSGIAVFLAAHAAVTGQTSSAELALAAVAHLRKRLKGRNSARLARSLGVGGATGLGSVVYALSVMSKLLNDDELLADASAATRLFTDDLIAADKELGVVGGSAGGILGLLRHHRDNPSADVLQRAIKCADHLLSQRRIGVQGKSSWVRVGLARPLNGMSHGAAGFAYALASLATATGRSEFAAAASECTAFENASYEKEHSNWPDLRYGSRSFGCQWCHGASGIGLARIAMSRLRGAKSKLDTDISNAVMALKKGSSDHLDTLCCGMLGNIEFLCEASSVLRRDDLSAHALRQLAAVIETAAAAGDYRWNAGSRDFNLGLFRGLAGIGYTMLRRVEKTLPNVLVWE